MRPCVGRATRVDRDRRVPFLVALGDHGFFPAVASRRVRCRRVAFRARFRRRGLRVLAGCRVGRVRRVPIACGRHGVDRRRDDRDRRVDRRLPGGTNGSCRVARVRVSSGASVQGGALRACPRISAFHGPLRAVPEAVHLGTFERAVVHSLCEQRLKIRRQRINCLIGQFFSASNVLEAVVAVERHVEPLQRELIARGELLARGKFLGDAQHLLKTSRVVARRRHKILNDLMVPARGQIDVLDVPGRLTIQNSADEELHGSIKALFAVGPIFRFDGHLVSCGVLRREVKVTKVIFLHFAPGSPIRTVENVLKLGESLGPGPIQLRSCLDEIWEGLLIKKLHPEGSAVHMDFSLPGSS